MLTDIVVYSKNRNPQLMIEVKIKMEISSGWAAKTRRNLLAHAMIPPSPFFLLASLEQLYLWKDSTSLDAVPPNYELKTAEILAPYLKQSTVKLKNMSKYSLEMLLILWLNDITRSETATKINGAKFKWLYESGLYEAIKDGSVLTEAVQ